MATEEGIVTRTDPPLAWIQTTRSSACEACTSKGSCNVLGGGNEMEIRARDPLNTRAGDRVVVEFKAGPLLQLTFILYMLPVLGLLAGAITGNMLAPKLGMDPSIAAILCGGSLLALIVLGIKAVSNRLASRECYQPRIIRIRQRAIDPETPHPGRETSLESDPLHP